MEASKPREWIRGPIIGAGAFGTVSLAINKSNGELFAVKSMATNSVSYLEKHSQELGFFTHCGMSGEGLQCEEWG
ncbi:hypothetical protein SUGI_0093450 [Cryptomeria japonica]|nr:hypothetical protein SUGI_0093450 [Cryptomeria japonica]